MNSIFINFISFSVKCTPALLKETKWDKNAPQILGERGERNQGKYEELGKNEKRLLVISGIMFDRKMGGHFEDRSKNIFEKERYIGEDLGVQRKNKLEKNRKKLKDL